MNNLEIGLLQDALMRYITDRYVMPLNMKDWKEKYELIAGIYDKLEAQRQHPTNGKK